LAAIGAPQSRFEVSLSGYDPGCVKTPSRLCVSAQIAETIDEAAAKTPNGHSKGRLLMLGQSGNGAP